LNYRGSSYWKVKPVVHHQLPAFLSRCKKKIRFAASIPIVIERSSLFFREEHPWSQQSPSINILSEQV
jgi:hypothetical protein